MEMGNVSKRQQPDHRKNNSRRSPAGLQCSEKFPQPEYIHIYRYIQNNMILILAVHDI